MLYAVDGVALGGWQLVDLGLMALVAIELLSLIFLKVVIILLGALLYATGPITIGLVATESGAAIARAWASAVVMLLALPVAWATLFAVGALLVGDAGTAGPLIAGQSSIGSLLGGVLLAVAGAASLWMCLRVAREAMGLLRMQLGGLLALSHRGSAAAGQTVSAAQSSSVNSLRRFSASVSRAAGGAAGQLAAAGPAGATVVRAGRAVGYVGRHGVLGTAGAGEPSGSGGSCAARSSARRSLARRRRGRSHGESRNRQLAGRSARRHRHRRAGERAELREPASGTVAARTGAACDVTSCPGCSGGRVDGRPPRGQQATRRTSTVGDRPGRSPSDATGRRESTQD